MARRPTCKVDPKTLEVSVDAVLLTPPNHGEMARSSFDHEGDVHGAGTLNKAPYETSGWYNTPS